MSLVLAVGTLKRGFALHDRGLRGAPFLGLYRTVARFPFVIAGPWFAPMLLDAPGEGREVRGELYAVDAARLQRLDRMESLGRPGNLRRLIEVRPLGRGASLQAFVYPKHRRLAVPRWSGLLDHYDDRRFVPPEARSAADRAHLPI